MCTVIVLSWSYGLPSHPWHGDIDPDSEALFAGTVVLQVGAAAAYLDHSTMPWLRVAGLLLGSVCVIAWLNLR